MLSVMLSLEPAPRGDGWDSSDMVMVEESCRSENGTMEGFIIVQLESVSELLLLTL